MIATMHWDGMVFADYDDGEWEACGEHWSITVLASPCGRWRAKITSYGFESTLESSVHGSVTDALRDASTTATYREARAEILAAQAKGQTK